MEKDLKTVDELLCEFNEGLNSLVEAVNVSQGIFDIEYLPQYAEFVPHVIEGLKKAEGLYQRANIQLKNRIEVVIKGKGVAKNPFYDPSTKKIQIIPQGFNENLSRIVEVLVHEIAHYYHENVISGGFKNKAIKDQYDIAKQEKNQGGSVREVALDEYNKQKSLVKRIAKKIAKEGLVFKLERFDKLINKDAIFTYKILGYTGKDEAEIEIIDVFEVKGNPVDYETKSKYFLNRPYYYPISTVAGWLTKEKDQFNYKNEKEKLEELRLKYNDIASGKVADTRFQEWRTDWLPTNYSRKNAVEWFAEMVTAAVLEPDSMKPYVRNWFQQIMKTGKVPDVENPSE
jgi:hypothetical protein